ncbi:MAG TPA: hypothetical protein VIL44_06605 [Micromonospora sp.]
MSPRRNRPARSRSSGRRRAGHTPLDEQRARYGVEGVQTWSDGQWVVRSIPGPSAVKTYRCPGCDHEIRPGVPHVVAWPADERGDLNDRRHWHNGCWRAHDRRFPVVRRARRG